MNRSEDLNKGITNQPKRFLLFFWKSLRLSNPWNYKVPVLISLVYFILFLNNYRERNVILAIVSSFIIIIGVAGMGYLTNDMGDRDKDVLIARPNSSLGLSWLVIFFLILGFLLLSILPWHFLAYNKWSFLFLGLEFLLFFIYAFKPFRLKERPILGLFCDALYAHVVPALLATYTFYLFSKGSSDTFYVALFCILLWQLFQGLRSIALHQLKDFSADVLSGTKTFATQFGNQKTESLIKILFLGEFLSFIIFSTFVAMQLFPFLFCYILYCLVKLKSIKKSYSDLFQLAFILFDNYYLNFMPFIILIALNSLSPIYFPVLIFHFFLFNNGLKRWIAEKLLKPIKD